MGDDPATFTLSATMKIEDCEALHQYLLSASDQDIVIDCSAVERLSGLAGQLLLMAHKVWQKNGQNLTLANRTDGLETGIAMLGLSALTSPKQVPA